jgi:predicted kinase
VPLGKVFGERLLFPPDFIGRGDMSRGSLLLRAARAGAELTYAPIAGAARHGPRAPGVGSQPPRAPLQAAPHELVILIGLPGAGKSTLFRERFAATHEHLSKDELRRLRQPLARHAQLLGSALAEQRSIVVDDTNLSREERAPLIAQAQRHGARVVGYFFEAGPRECLARNRGREGAARVPDAAILAAAKRLVRPTLDEGFDELLVLGARHGAEPAGG